MGINWTETVRFLKWLDTTSHNYIWQTFDDSPEKRPTLACAILAEPMDTRIEALRNALDDATLARRITPLEHDNESIAGTLHPILQTYQLSL